MLCTCLFSGFFHCYVGISCTICFLVCLIVTLVSRALFVLGFVWLLHWYLARYLFSGLFDCYVGTSRTICILVYTCITLASGALFFCFGFLTVTLVSHALCFFWFVWLLRWYLGHYFFSGFSNCYVGILRSVCFLVCSTVTLVSHALFVLRFFFWFFFLHNMILTLTTLRFLSRDSLRTLRYTTYSTLKIQLIFMLRTLFYLYYVQCDNAHIFRGTSFTHKKRETLLAALYKNY